MKKICTALPDLIDAGFATNRDLNLFGKTKIYVGHALFVFQLFRMTIWHQLVCLHTELDAKLKKKGAWQMSIKNTSELRDMLLGAITLVKDGKMEPSQAQAIANLSSRVLQSAKLDLDVLKYNVANKDAAKAGTSVLQLVNA